MYAAEHVILQYTVIQVDIDTNIWQQLKVNMSQYIMVYEKDWRKNMIQGIMIFLSCSLQLPLFRSALNRQCIFVWNLPSLVGQI